MTLTNMQAQLDQCLEMLQSSSFFQVLLTSLQQFQTEQRQFQTIICYGIGNFGEISEVQTASMWQLAAAVALQQKFSLQHFLFFDPCMTDDEARFLARQNVDILPQNEQGRRSIREPCFFFMPHCPLRLYTNVLYTNWDHLDLLCIFGNSLSSYANRLLNVNDAVELLRLLKDGWVETLIPLSKTDIAECSGYFEQAFNDSSTTFFTRMSKHSMGPRPENYGVDIEGEELIG